MSKHEKKYLSSSDDESPVASKKEARKRPSKCLDPYLNPVPGTSSAPTQAAPSRSAPAVTPPPPSAKKHKPRIQPAAPAQQLSSYDLFGTDSEDDDAVHHRSTKAGRPREDPKTATASKKRSRSPHSSMSVPPPPPPPSPARNATARDLFGSDSDDDDFDDQAANPGKKLAPLNSYLTRKLDKGVVRKMWDSKPGSHYVELKVYKCDDILRVQPMNRWRHAAISIKNRTYDDTLAWQALSKFIVETRKEFKHCPPTFIGI